MQNILKRIFERISQKEIKELKESLGNVICSFLQSQEEVSDLKSENHSLEATIKSLENENATLRLEIEEIEAKHKEQLKEESDGRYRAIYAKADADRKAEALEKENKILRKYYGLSDKASDDIKKKIRIDLEIKKLEEENKRLKEINSAINSMVLPPIYTPSYPYYGFGRGLM